MIVAWGSKSLSSRNKCLKSGERGSFAQRVVKSRSSCGGGSIGAKCTARPVIFGRVRFNVILMWHAVAQSMKHDRYYMSFCHCVEVLFYIYSIDIYDTRRRLWFVKMELEIMFKNADENENNF